jgi:uncharacterized protein YjbJ (UPF0337 family)
MTIFGHPIFLKRRSPTYSTEISGLQNAEKISARSEPSRQEESMKQSTKDQATGKLHEMKGKIKEKAGQATNNANLANEGQDEKVGGKIQKKVGQIEKVFEK